MTDLLVAPCSYDAAKYAVMHWHYSRTMPRGGLIRFGVWEDSVFIGAVIYGRGARDYGATYGLDTTQCAELVRVALTNHVSPVTQIVGKSLRSLSQTNPGLRLIVSFADPAQGHSGVIYKAGSWVYTGRSQSSDEWVINGKQVHGRQVSHIIRRLPQSNLPRLEKLRTYVDPDAHRVTSSEKHRYLYPLDRAMRRQIESLRLPYPPAVEGSKVSRDASGVEGQVRPLPTAPTKDRDDG